MKMVQSLWSVPGSKEAPNAYMEKNKCGWPSKKYNYISWALSCLQLRQYYDEVELVTDKEGYELLIDKMQLPYTSVKLELDELKDYHPKLYALGKIHAYRIQDKPFIHVDGDVFIWERFGKDFEDSALLCQNMESGVDYNRWYLNVFVEVAERFEFYPDIMDRSISKNDCIVAINAGIIGGNDIGFFKDFTKEAIEFVDRNIAHLPKIRVDLFNTIFEHFLFYAMAEERKLKITCYNPLFEQIWAEVSDFSRVPSAVKYIHTIGKLKKSRYVIEAMEDRLAMDYPEYYSRIINLLRTHQI
jgi:hypothetical protein